MGYETRQGKTEATWAASWQMIKVTWNSDKKDYDIFSSNAYEAQFFRFQQMAYYEKLHDILIELEIRLLI